MQITLEEFESLRTSKQPPLIGSAIGYCGTDGKIHPIESESLSQPNVVDRDLGQNIVVLDRGFVYVGDVTVSGDYVTITNAKNIRRWGTSKGLGELCNGPLADTVLDKVESGVVLTFRKAVNHFISVKGF